MRRWLAGMLQRATAERILSLVYGPVYRLTLRRMGRGARISAFITSIGLDCVSLGAGSRISRGARILVQRRWRDQTFEPQLTIGDNVAIGLNSTISCMRRVEIGDHCTLSDQVYIADSQHEFRDIERGIRDQPLIVGQVVIGRRVWIGNGAVIAGDLTIGDNAVIGANTVIKRSVEPYTVVVGAPARVISRYSFKTRKWEPAATAGAPAPRAAERVR